MLVRFSIHQINALGSYWYLSESFVAEKRHGAMQKLFKSKKERKEKKKGDWEKNRQVSEISKIMGTWMPAWKKDE